MSNKIKSFVYLNFNVTDSPRVFDKLSLIHDTYNGTPQAYPKQLLQRYTDKLTGVEVTNPFYIFAQ